MWVLEERGADQLVACEDTEATLVFFPAALGDLVLEWNVKVDFLGVRKVRARLVWSSSHIFWNILSRVISYSL